VKNVKTIIIIQGGLAEKRMEKRVESRKQTGSKKIIDPSREYLV
jgi:hypothetical protein